jgi:HEAT repeat protein
MDAFERSFFMRILSSFLIVVYSIGYFLFFNLHLSANSTFSRIQEGRLLFLIQQGQSDQAVRLYQSMYESSQEHNFELLHQIGLAILEYGSHQRDPESQLFALLGASVSAHEDAFFILEESLKSPHLSIQLAALEALSRFQNDRADQALIRALTYPSLVLRYHAIQHLCKKKHFDSINQAESLLYKTSKKTWPLYPPLFAMVESKQSTQILKKFLYHPSTSIRLSAILSVAKYHREDLLPAIRQQALQAHYTQQEASAYAIGKLKDEESIPILYKLSLSQYPSVVLAAHYALYCLGKQESAQWIEQAAQQGNLYAIHILGRLHDHSKVLIELISHPNLQIRYNAKIALLKQPHPKALEFATSLFVQDQRNIAFTSQKSPGGSLKSWKITFSANKIFKDDGEAYQEHLQLKESLLKKVKQLSSHSFIGLAHQIFEAQQNDLVPLTVSLLEQIGTSEAIDCLKVHQQQFGAPLIRNYCKIALYRLEEPGSYCTQICNWVKKENQTSLIQFTPLIPWEMNDLYRLSAEETSRLLLAAFEALAIQQDTQGIDTLLDSIATGHPKNRYALAGLLVRATQ